MTVNIQDVAKTVTIPDQVFCTRGTDQKPVYQIAVGGKVLPHTWSDIGAAHAGLQTEQRRYYKELSQS